MTVVEYLDRVKERLLTDPLVVTFRIIKERATPSDGFVRARLTLSDGSLLEFSEYAQASAGQQVNILTYSYQWMSAEGRLVRRWDNAPHFPALEAFPHHVHDGPGEEVVRPGKPVGLFDVLEAIQQSLGNASSE